MNAIVQLTPKERDRARRELFEEKRKDYFFMVEVVGERIDWHKSYAIKDFVSMGEMLDRQLWDYLERTGMFQDAEEELLSSKQINGKNWLTA
jgi:hypothetical protein